MSEQIIAKLMLCPFCGRDDVAVESSTLETGQEWYEVVCGRCDIEGPGGFTVEQAVIRWNRRNTIGSKSDAASAE